MHGDLIARGTLTWQKSENILIVDGTDINISDFGAAIIKKDDSSEITQIAGVGSLRSATRLECHRTKVWAANPVRQDLSFP